MEKVRLADVAARAGVSIRTVANVVSNHPHVKAETRARVQEAIEQLGYRPNVAARRLARGRAGTVSFAISSIAVPIYAELAHLLIEAAQERDYNVLIEETRAEKRLERAVIARQEDGLVDGVILMTNALTSPEILRHRGTVPLVLLGEAAAPADVDHFVIDNQSAAKDATRVLIGGGARFPAFLGAGHDDRSRWIGRGRLAGWQAALEENHIEVAADRVWTTQGWTFEDGFDRVTAALTAGVEFDAIFCCEDMLALGALAALAARGVRVPAQVAVTGWDDIASAAYAIPALTTVAGDKRQMIRSALDRLLERIEGSSDPVVHTLVPHRIQVRQSTRPAGVPQDVDSVTPAEMVRP